MAGRNSSSREGELPVSLIGGVVLSWLLVACGFAFVLPAFESVYKDRNLTLPDLTRQCLSFSHWLRGDGAWAGSTAGWIILIIPWLALLIVPAMLSGMGGTQLLGKTLLVILRVVLICAVIFLGAVLALPLMQHPPAP